MNRNDFQLLSNIRLREAQALFSNNCFEGAYYLAGYSIECALKACISKKIKKYDFPDKKTVSDSYCHDLDKLINVAGLRPKLDEKININPSFQLNWTIVKDWSEESRYINPISQAKANDLISAITSRRNGVIRWLKNCW